LIKDEEFSADAKQIIISNINVAKVKVKKVIAS